MRNFARGSLRLNLLSALYALPFTVCFELGANYYRIKRLTGWNQSQMSFFTQVCPALLWLVVSLSAYAWTRKYMGTNRFRYASALLWLPYAYMFSYAFSFFFPITNPGDDPNPVVGLMLMAGAAAYPVYVLIVNALAPVDWRFQVDK